MNYTLGGTRKGPKQLDLLRQLQKQLILSNQPSIPPVLIVILQIEECPPVYALCMRNVMPNTKKYVESRYVSLNHATHTTLP